MRLFVGILKFVFPFMMRVMMAMTVVMIMMMVMFRVRMGFGHFDISSCPDEHPCGDAKDDHPGSQLKPGLRFLRIPVTAIAQARGGQHPDHERMRNRGGNPQQHGLENRAPDAHNKRSHHRLGMPGFQAMERAEKHRAWDEEPGAGRAVLEKFCE